ncbi:hypothetical protein ACFULT_26255 [Rhodococcus sp. NPDC057297]|uniref:hypothetical protein n=1 Tax=Rhodococcus sp. NPDC057297 TaxID=3346090 RepID=UPI00362964B8
MEISEILEHVNPTWGALFLIVAAILTFSKTIAELDGKFKWIGVIARAWSERQVRKVQRENELERERRKGRDEAYAGLQDQVTDLNTELIELREVVRKQRTDHDDELEAARLEHREEIRKTREEHHHEMAAIRRELDGKNAYIVLLLQWGHTSRVNAAAKGFELDPMPEEDS